MARGRLLAAHGSHIIRENSMALLSTNLLGILNRSAEAGASSAMASVSGTASGQIASASAKVETIAHGQGATSVIHATVQATADDIQVTSTGNAMASGETASTLVSLAANADPDGAIVAVGAVTAKADAEAAEGGVGAATSLAATQVEVKGIEISSSGHAAGSGEEASTLVTMVASVDQETGIVVMDLAQAEAQATEDGSASATASTDAAADDNLVISKEQVTIITDGSHPVVVSVTYLQGAQADPETAPIDPVINSADFANLQMDMGFLGSES
jgi:hypothetical protein